MRKWLAILLLVFMPLQFSWAAVVSYCQHEAEAKHFGHHQHHAKANSNTNLDTTADGKGDAAPDAMDLDCDHCHGYCGVMLTPSSGLHDVLLTAPPSATLDEVGGAHAPTRPDRPQWLARH